MSHVTSVNIQHSSHTLVPHFVHTYLATVLTKIFQQIYNFFFNFSPIISLLQLPLLKIIPLRCLPRQLDKGLKIPGERGTKRRKGNPIKTEQQQQQQQQQRKRENNRFQALKLQQCVQNDKLENEKFKRFSNLFKLYFR